MRGLQLQDVFTVVRLLGKLQINKDTLKGLTSTFDPKSVNVEGLSEEEAKKAIFAAREEAANEKGLEVFFTVLSNAPEAEEEVYKFISSLMEYNDVDRARTMNFDELGLLFKEIREMKGLKGFLSQVSKFMK